MALNFIEYPEAMRTLSKKHGANPTNLVGWVARGPEEGGLWAYEHANEFEDPPRFFYTPDCPEDPLEPLVGCWFNAREIARFQPKERFITGAELVARWTHPTTKPTEAFIVKKIEESRLEDYHPATGSTRWTEDEGPYASRESAIFSLSQVKQIEAEARIGPMHWEKDNQKPAVPGTKREINKMKTSIRDAEIQALYEKLAAESPSKTNRQIASAIKKYPVAAEIKVTRVERIMKKS